MKPSCNAADSSSPLLIQHNSEMVEGKPHNESSSGSPSRSPLKRLFEVLALTVIISLGVASMRRLVHSHRDKSGQYLPSHASAIDAIKASI